MQYIKTKPMNPWQGILFGLIFAVVGIGLLLFSVSTIKNYNEKNKTYKEIMAEVIDYAYNNDGLEAIIVEYTIDGKTYRKQSNSYSNMPKQKGTQVKVKYNTNDPSDAIWANDSTNIVLPIAGGVFTLIGIIIVATSLKKMKSIKATPTIKQSKGLYNSADVVISLQNDQNLEQFSQNQQPVSQSQSSIANQVQDTFNQNSNFIKEQDQTNNQNNTNSNL